MSCLGFHEQQRQTLSTRCLMVYLCWGEAYYCQVWPGGALDPGGEAPVVVVEVVGLCWD